MTLSDFFKELKTTDYFWLVGYQHSEAIYLLVEDLLPLSIKEKIATPESLISTDDYLNAYNNCIQNLPFNLKYQIKLQDCLPFTNNKIKIKTKTNKEKAPSISKVVAVAKPLKNRNYYIYWQYRSMLEWKYICCCWFRWRKYNRIFI